MRDDIRVRLEELDDEELETLLDLHADLAEPPGFDKPDYKAAAQLADHPGMDALEQEVRRQREMYMLRIGRTLTTSREAANQRQIDHYSGYYLGALWAVARLPQALKKKVAKDAGAELPEPELTFEDLMEGRS